MKRFKRTFQTKKNRSFAFGALLSLRAKRMFFLLLKDCFGLAMTPNGKVLEKKDARGFVSYVFIFLLFFGGIFLIRGGIVQSAPSAFTQSNWAGGIPTDSITCSNAGGTWGTECLAAAVGYTGYNAIDAGVVAGSDLRLGSSDYDVTGTSDIDFNAGTLTATTVAGTGDAAGIELSKVLTVDGFGAKGTTVSDPGPYGNKLTDIAVDAGYIYLAGYDATYGNNQWRFEKRKIDTGALETAFDADGFITSDPSTGDDRLQAIAVDGSDIYAAGDDFFLEEQQWHIEKWDITTGEMADGSDGLDVFGEGGIVRSNPSTSDDFITDIVEDGTYIYVAGYDASPGNYQWRVEKRDKASGALETENFGVPNGYITSNPSGGHDILRVIAIDGNDIYLAGSDDYLGNNYRWRIEKRDKTTGAPVTGFGTNGVVVNNPSGNEDAVTAIAVDSSYIYVAGYDGFPGNYQWRVEKRNKTSGALETVSFGAPNGYITSNPGTTGHDVINDIAVDANYIYLAGYDASPSAAGDYQMRIEKRDINTGALAADFDADGIFTRNPSSGSDIFVKIAVDAGYIYAGGIEYNDVTGKYRMHVGKLSKSASLYAASGTFESATIDLGGNNYALKAVAADATVSPNVIAGLGREISSADPGVAALWHLDAAASTATTAADSASAGTYTGTLVAAGATASTAGMWSTGGKLGSAAYNALKFSGDEYVNVDSSISGTAVKSVSFWINDSNSTDAVLQVGAAYIAVSGGSITTDGFPSPTVYVNGSSASATLSAGWNHVAVVDNTPVTASTVYLGYANGSYMSGLLDEVAFYSSALSAYEVKKLYDGPAVTFQIAADAEGDGPWNFTGPDGTADSFFAWEPVGLWHLNETSGTTAADASGRGHDGTVVGPVHNASGQKLGAAALFFDGIDDYVSVGDIEADVRSVEFWINHSNPAGGDGILELSATGYITIAATTGDITAAGLGSSTIYVNGSPASAALSAGAWNHVVVVTDTAVPASAVKFGVVSADYMAGFIDEIVMYDRALTQGEVTARYNSGSGREGAAAGGLAGAGLDNKRYIRYKANLRTGDTAYTPKMNDVSIGFSGFPSGAAITSSVFDTGADAGFLTTLSWSETLNGQAVRLQVASSADNGTWNYCGKSACSAENWLDFTIPGNYYELGDALHTQLRDADSDRYFKYRVWMGGLTGTAATPVVDDINIGYDTAHLEVLAPDGIATTYAPNVGQTFNVVLKAKDSGGTVMTRHAGLKTVELTAAVAQPNTSCTSSFNGGTTYSSGVTFVAGEAAIPVTLCDAAVTGSFTFHARETSGGALASTDGDGYPLTIPEVNQIVSAITPGVTLSTYVAGQTATATVSFTTANSLNADDKVEVTFDSDFTISGATFNSGNVGSTLSAASNVLRVTLGTAVGSSEAVSLVIGGITNPPVPQTTSAYAVVTKTGSTTLDAGTTISGSDIVAAFSFTNPPPSSTVSWAVNETTTLAWTTIGTVSEVKIEYSISGYNGGAYYPIKESEGAADDGIISNAGIYTWTVEDLVDLAGDPQLNPMVSVTLKVSDADAGHPAASGISNALTVKYYAITWQVLDINNMPVNSLNVSEPATAVPGKAIWTVNDNTFSGNNTVRYYPYNGDSATDAAYSTTFSRSEGGTTYTAANTAWRANGDKTVTVVMKTAATAAAPFTVNIDAHYDTAGDAIGIVAWLTKEGDVVAPGADTSGLQSISADIYDGTGAKLNTADLGTGVTADANGIFRMTYDPAAGLNPDSTYRIKAVISHLGETYSGLTASIVPSRDTSVARIGTVYDADADALKISVWLERGSVTVAVPDGMTLTVLGADGIAVTGGSFNASDATIANGIYSMTWDPDGGINSDDIYTLKAQVTYRGKTYEAAEAFSKGELGAIASNIQGVDTGITNQTAAISAGTAAVLGDISAQTTDIKAAIASDVGAVGTSVTGLKAETSADLAALQTAVGNVPASIDTALSPAIAADVAGQLAKGVQAEIVTRPAAVTTGATVPIRFRTASGLSPKITVYDPANSLLLNSTAMTEISTTGIYEYKLLMQSGWGLGDFTVVVNESTKQSVDSLVLHVAAESAGGTTGGSSAITIDTLYSRINNMNSNIDALMAGVETVNGSTADVSSDIDKLLKKSGVGAGGGAAAMTDYVNAVTAALGTAGDSRYETILGKLTGIEAALADIGADAATAVALNASAQRQAFTIAQLAVMVREKLEAGELEGAEEDMATLNDTLTQLRETIQSVPSQMTADSITASVGQTLSDLTRVAAEKGLEDLVPEVAGGMAEGGKALGPKEALEMRNEVSELKSLMLEIRGLLDQEVNQPIIHGWLEGEE